MNRRHFLSQAATATTALGNSVSQSAPETTGIIDTQIYLGRHPFRESISADPESLAKKLASKNVIQGWAGSFEALLQRDMASVNARLVALSAVAPVFKAVGSVNPKLLDWRMDLRRCAEDHGMKIIRLHPNYHGYNLGDAAFLDLLKQATDLGLVIQIVAQMEDERTQHPLVQVKPVDLRPLPAAVNKVSKARVMVLNASRAMSMTVLAGCKVWLDIAMLEGVGGVANLLKDWPLDHLVFSSHAPFFYWESAWLKLVESDLSQKQRNAILRHNVEALI